MCILSKPCHCQMKEPFGPAGDVDARAAYLFFCPFTNRYGVTLDKSGSNLPQQGCDAGWQLQAEFPLGIHEALPAPMDPEPILRGIRSVGYFVCGRVQCAIRAVPRSSVQALGQIPPSLGRMRQQPDYRHSLSCGKARLGSGFGGAATPSAPATTGPHSLPYACLPSPGAI
jgi:hypothetical protein